MLEPNDSEFLWIVVVGFIVAFVLAFGIGANDVANSFGTSVGAKVLTLRQACVIATIFELAGAILIGARVSDTVRKGIIDINSFNGTEELAMIGSLSALSGTGIWLLVATFFNLPVSGTHSVVGATMGYALVAHGLKGIKWKTFGLIAVSWVVSPLMSGIISSLLFMLVRRLILSKMRSFEVGLKSLPFFYAFTISINFFSVFYKGSNVLHFDKIPLYGVLILSIGGGILAAVIVHFLISPYLKKKILREVYGDEDEPTTIPPQIKAVSFTKSVSDPDVNSEEKRLTAIKEVKEPDEDPNQDEYELDRVNLHISPVSVVPPDNETPEPICQSSNAETPEPNCQSSNTEMLEPSNQFSVESTADSEMFIETSEHNGTGPKLICQSSNAETSEPNCQSSNAETSEPSHQVSVESTTDSEMLIETNEQNGTVPSEAQKERARSRGMSLLMEARKRVTDEPKTGKLFAFLQILTASFGAFAHGGNDVSNAIGPLISLWVIFSSGMIQDKVLIPVWILVYGGVGICVGLFIWGRRVIKTVGEDLTPITPSSGFAIEIGSALTVLCASNLGIPISTTHCKVGSVVMVGRVRSKEVVDWYLFRNVILAWAVTMPFAGLVSAGLYAALREAV